MKEFRQNTKYKDILSEQNEDQAAEPETKAAGGRGNRYSLPYGLCESVGIDTRGMTPREAWDAWTSKTGRTKEDAEREHWGKTADGQKQPVTLENPQADKSPEPTRETSVKANETAKTETQPIEKQNAETATPKDRSFTVTNHGVDEGLAARATDSYSMWGYKSGSATAGYNSDINKFEKNVNDLINRYKANDALTEEDWAQVEEIAQRYSENLSKYTNESNRVEASYPSWFVAGPANYNTRKNDAKHSRLRRLYEENSNRIDPDDNVYLKKIKNILSGTNIQSNDSNAVGKLQKKLDGLKQSHEAMKGAMAYYRKNGTFRGFEHPGISAETLSKEEDFIKRNGWGGFNLTNSSAEIRRTQSRIDELNKVKAGAEAAKANPEAAAQATAAKYPKVDGVEAQENAEQMRVQLRFPGKPDEATRTLLKSHGFRWSPSQGAWQRQLTGNGTYAARQVMETLAKQKQ